MSSHRLCIARRRRREVFREKIVLIMIAAIAAVCCSIILSTRLVDAHDNASLIPDSNHKYYRSIEVEYGDTLWDIASEYVHDDNEAIRSYVRELKEVNKLTSDDIHAGEYLTVVYYN